MSRRVKRYLISPEMLMRTLIDGRTLSVVSGIPKGATFEGWALCPQTNRLYIFVQHDSFDIVPESCPCPDGDGIVMDYKEIDLRAPMPSRPFDIDSDNADPPRVSMLPGARCVQAPLVIPAIEGLSTDDAIRDLTPEPEEKEDEHYKGYDKPKKDYY